MDKGDMQHSPWGAMVPCLVAPPPGKKLACTVPALYIPPCPCGTWYLGALILEEMVEYFVSISLVMA